MQKLPTHKKLFIIGVIILTIAILSLVFLGYKKGNDNRDPSSPASSDQALSFPNQTAQDSDGLAASGGRGEVTPDQRGEQHDEGAAPEPVEQAADSDAAPTDTTPVSASDQRRFKEFKIDLSKTAIDLDEILSGGPGRDGIPALSNPHFVSIVAAEKEGVTNEAIGMYIESTDGGRFYPYDILVWHEIVNDVIDDVPVAITFCPLCGSAIGYERTLPDGRVTEFGVSGFLRESNMIMYDRLTESFWQQSHGESIAGSLTGTELEHIPVNLITFAELKKAAPNAQVLSRDTGHFRDYGIYPYGAYESDENFYFPVSEFSDRYPAKELMYVIALENGDTLALPNKKITEGTHLEYPLGEISQNPKTTSSILLTKNNGIIRAIEMYTFHDENGETTEDFAILPGYFEMWFSWVISNPDTSKHRVWE